VLGAIYRAKWVGLLTVAHGSRASGGWSAIGCYCRGSTPTAWGLGLRNSVKTTLFKFFFFSFFFLLLLYIFFYLWGPKNGLQQMPPLYNAYGAAWVLRSKFYKDKQNWTSETDIVEAWSIWNCLYSSSPSTRKKWSKLSPLEIPIRRSPDL
jgi:hypothetical protein